MHLIFDAKALKNEYFGMRHGTGKPNVERRISCQIDYDSLPDGLTAEGEQEVIMSAHQALLGGIIRKNPMIFSSMFLRCRESAMIAGRALKATNVLHSNFLNERNFGKLHDQPISNCKNVLKLDGEDLLEPDLGVETSFEVASRSLELIAYTESRYTGRQILFIGHSDPLDIMNTLFLGIPPGKHKAVARPWGLAEIRKFDQR